ncbi:diguanylate cyclase with PAS/PAC sensor [Desulforamulus reducens MI-1]|uniref:Diguanylate cyclase with PAS/PAC sensor n=1 Tax=Desulforamulus reducens (strain ATCC BAA-1160 / DSM 100696 / MI-1) TaxID=349161 RepID=A4J2L5_DESRM|nr:diguanylate cyclase [Desulforamulus reducens]ABO49318.1 diguanylate cyclase with PAS/PAC sensor [Desulforamulus reducens MI-1]
MLVTERELLLNTVNKLENKISQLKESLGACKQSGNLDITAYKKLEEELRLKAQLLDLASDAIYLTDLEGHFIYLNDSAYKNRGYTHEEMMNMSIYDFHLAENRELANQHKQTVLEKGQNTFETIHIGKNRMIPVEINSRLIEKGNKKLILSIVRDITERKSYEAKLHYLSMHDHMTGLFNRAYFEQAIERYRNTKCSLAFIMVDINGLKLINDTMGHQVGDTLLKDTANLINSTVGKRGVVARFGGDEFAILLNNTDEVLLEEIKRQLIKEVRVYNKKKPELHLSISIGYATSHNSSKTIDELVKEADDFMYRAKLHRNSSIRSSLVQTLVKALEARDFITEGHGNRLEDIMSLIGKRVNLPSSKIYDLRLLAHFHDIGKVGIPDRILFKPGALTQDERKEMQRHSEIGYRIAQSSTELMPIANWILQHHERWDGKGYPLGIKGEEIPLECRALAIVDAYDAMINDRPYRKGMTHKDAIWELSRCAGTQFDPHLLPIVVEILEDVYQKNKKNNYTNSTTS